MRILHVSTRLILGGSQENTVLSCEGQARLGHEVHLAFGPIYGPEGSLLQRVEEFNRRCERGEERVGVAWANHPESERSSLPLAPSPTTLREGESCKPILTHVVPDMIREVNPGRDRQATGQLKELIAKLKPDIVHTHSSKAGIIGRAAAWAVNKRLAPSDRMGVIHTIHGPPFMPVDGSLVRQLKIRAINRVYQVAERYAARRCHAIVSVCDEMTRQFLGRGIGRPEQYVTVYSGMETERFLVAGPGESRAEVRTKLGIGPERLMIGTVARLAEHKGHDDLLEAVGEDLRRNPSWALLWVGNGWWRERLVAKAKGMGLGVCELDKWDGPDAGAETGRAAQVYLTGLVPPEHVPGLMRAMDVLAHPSYREGLPRTVPQALLAGTCPVAYDVDGTREACIEMETGRLVPPADRARLREAIVWLAEHPGEREAMARRGRELCRVRFSTQTMVRDLEGVYARAAGAARAG